MCTTFAHATTSQAGWEREQLDALTAQRRTHPTHPTKIHAKLPRLYPAVLLLLPLSRGCTAAVDLRHVSAWAWPYCCGAVISPSHPHRCALLSLAQAVSRRAAVRARGDAEALTHVSLPHITWGCLALWRPLPCKPTSPSCSRSVECTWTGRPATAPLQNAWSTAHPTIIAPTSL